MNKELELQVEAEKYNKDAPISEMYLDEAFIAGATSKWVEKQKLEFAIDQLKKLKEDETYDKIKYVESSFIDYELMKLEQKLSEL